MSRLSLLSLAGAALLLSACQSYDAEQASPPPGMERMASFTDKFFAVMDRNKDGKVTRAERRAAPHQNMLQPFSKVDVNGDGVLTLEEYREVMFRLHSQPMGEDV